MTLAEAIAAVIAAYDEDEDEREAIIAELAPVVLDAGVLAYAIGLAWGDRADEIREAIASYQAQRAAIDQAIHDEDDAS